jgi:hypothetical protein
MTDNNEIPSIVVPLTPEEIADREQMAIDNQQRAYDFVASKRQAGYQQTSDPIFMQYQRGEATEQEWLDAVQAVKDANPYPVQEAL